MVWPSPRTVSRFFVNALTNGWQGLQQWFSPTDMRGWPLPQSTGSGLPREWNPLLVVPDGRHLILGSRCGAIHVLRINPQSTAHPPLEEEWLRKVSRLPGQEQLKAVHEKCKQRNPDLDSPFAGTFEGDSLVGLDASGSGLFDATPLQVLPLRRLNLQGQPLVDLSPLQDLSLKGIWLDFLQERGHAAVLRSIKTLQTINGKPADEFLKENAPQPQKP